MHLAIQDFRALFSRVEVLTPLSWLDSYQGNKPPGPDAEEI